MLYGSILIFTLAVTIFIASSSPGLPDKTLAGEAFKYELFKYFTACGEDEFWGLISSSEINEEEFIQYTEQTNCKSIVDSIFSLTENCEGILGDIENDGDVELSDAKFLFEFLIFPDFFPGIACGDLNSDNSITYSDLVLLINIINS